MSRSHVNQLVLVTCLLVTIPKGVQAQLEITEIMFDSAAEEPKWEWFEVRNAGSEDVDLDGYVFDDLSTTAGRSGPNIIGALSDEVTLNTIVLSGKVAVLYNGRALDFNEERFRSAWKLADSVPLIGVDGWQSLNNGGDAFGVWSNLDAYNLDLANTDEDDDLEVAQFDNSATWINFTVDFPSPSGASIEWSGEGDFRAGENWSAAQEGTATQSIESFLEHTAINSSSDIGSPGVAISDGEASSLVITELMYNPASAEPGWEWIEVFNGSGDSIVFSETPHYLDDLAGNSLSEPNIDGGEIPAGGTAVLFGDGVTVDNMRAAWGEDTNFIPVGRWQPLNNGGDLIAIWDDAQAYAADSIEAGRSDTEAVTSVNYLAGDADWPNASDGQSISLTDLAGDPNDPANWVLSKEGDGSSLFANAVISSQLDHAGGDLGTPGAFGDIVTVEPVVDLDVNDDGSVNVADAALLCQAVTAAGADLGSVLADAGRIAGDFDLNGDVDFADFLTLSASFTKEGTYADGDANCDGTVQFSDFLAMTVNFGESAAEAASVPEPNTRFLLILAAGGISCLWRCSDGAVKLRNYSSIP